MKNIKKEDIIPFLITLSITCIIFFPFLTGHYATDTYHIYDIGYEKYAITYSLNDGRIFMAVIGYIASKINLKIELFVIATLFLALIVSCIAVIVLKKYIEEHRKPDNLFKKILTTLLAYITIFNFMYIENLYFVESFVMAISLLLFIVSAKVLVDRNKNATLKSLLITALAVMFYQGTIQIFIIMTVLFTILKNKERIKEIIIDVIKCGVVSFCSVIFNIILVKIIGVITGLEQTRLGSVKSIFYNINVIFANTHKILIGTCGLFPKYLFLIFLFITTLCLIIYVEKNKKHYSTLLKVIFIAIFCIFSSSLTYILTLTCFNAGRLRFAIGAMLGIIFILIYVETNIFYIDKTLKNIMIGIIILYTIIDIYGYLNLIYLHKKVNEFEKYETEKIGEYINDYEYKTNIEVKKVKKINASFKRRKGYYPPGKIISVITSIGIRGNNESEGVIKFYTKRNLEKCNTTQQDTIKYWESAPSDGYKCIGDTLYVEIYNF